METVFAISNAFGRTKQTEESQVAAASLMRNFREVVVNAFQDLYNRLPNSLLRAEEKFKPIPYPLPQFKDK